MNTELVMCIAFTSTSPSCTPLFFTSASTVLVMFTNPKIQTFARDVFDYFMEGKGGRDRARGLAYIKRHVLEPFGRGKVTNNVLRQWFCKLAETREGYRCEDWDSLCRDEQGNDATGELRFQMRLELANLYRQAQVTATT